MSAATATPYATIDFDSDFKMREGAIKAPMTGWMEFEFCNEPPDLVSLGLPIEFRLKRTSFGLPELFEVELLVNG